MTRKQNIQAFLILFMALTFCGCAKQDDPIDRTEDGRIPIEFQASLADGVSVTGGGTRSDPVGVSVTDQLLIYGLYGKDGAESTWDESRAFINSQLGVLSPLDREDLNGIPLFGVNYGTHYYLADPTYGYLFRMITPITQMQGVTIEQGSATELPRITVNIVDNPMIGDQPDLMIGAGSVLERRSNIDPEPVAITFYHVLAKLVFSIQEYSLTGTETNPEARNGNDEDIYLESMEAYGPARGTMDLPLGFLPGWMSNSEKYPYPDEAELIKVIYSRGATDREIPISSTKESVGEVLVLPQATTGMSSSRHRNTFILTLSTGRRITFTLPPSLEGLQSHNVYRYLIQVHDNGGNVKVIPEEGEKDIEDWEVDPVVY